MESSSGTEPSLKHHKRTYYTHSLELLNISPATRKDTCFIADFNSINKATFRPGIVTRLRVTHRQIPCNPRFHFIGR